MNLEPIIPIVRPIIMALPALLVVLFVGMIALLALVMNEPRRNYALDFSKRGIDLAKVLVGMGARPALAPGARPPRRKA